MDGQLSFDLADADPVKDSDDETARYLVRQMSTAARQRATVKTSPSARWWKRRRFVLPLSIVGVIALTGSAALIPLTLWVNGSQVDPDVRIPIIYTTDTGVEVNCEYWIYYGEPGLRDSDQERLIAFLDSHDWTGIGQRAYAEAIADPFDTGEAGSLQDDTPQARDRISLDRGITRMVRAEVPNDVRAALDKEGYISASTSSCEGQLH